VEPVSTVEEIERAIDRLPSEEFRKLAAWLDQRQRERAIARSASNASTTYPEPEPTAHNACALRDHSSFLNSYGPEDEGLYDDAAAR